MKLIPLSQGKFTEIDDSDFEIVNCFKWHLKRSRSSLYAARTVQVGDKRITLFLHQFLMGARKIDHRDGYGLNNQRHNLRHATHAQNCCNRKKRCDGVSKYIGLAWRPREKVWRVAINVSGTRHHLGTFECEEDAAHVYDYAAKIYFGEFARLNFN